MSTVVCQQGVQPCIESSNVVEAKKMRLKLVAQKSHNEVTKNNEFGGWSCLQSLAFQKPFKKESAYVNPWVNQSSHLKLSPKSLELCTESLGSETGSDTSQGNMFLFTESRPLNTRSQETLSRTEERNLVPETRSKKVASRRFPPPLTTISSSNLLYVRPHRKCGRLIIEAMEAPSANSCFQAERSHGRLRLTYWKSEDDNFDLQSEERDDPAEPKTDPTNAEKADNEDDYGYKDEDEEDDIRMNGFDAELELEKQKFQRPSRCKEGGHGDKGLCSHWEPFWLATS